MDFQKICQSRRNFTILYVVDSVFWITGIMAKEMARTMPYARTIVCSYPVLRKLLDENGGRFPLKVDLVHFLIASYANREHDKFFDHAAIVSSILHVEDESSLLPLRYSDAVMTMSQQWQENVSGLAPDPSRIVKVPVGIDVKACRPARNPARVQKIRSKFGIPSDAFVVGFSAKRSSNTSDRKGVDVLENLILATATRNKNIWWVIRGPGWQDWIEPLAQKGLKLVYLPFQLPGKGLASSYQMLDAFICTSKIEGGPIPLLEAMATGLPCISTPVGYAIESIIEGENGFLVPFGDVESIHRKLTLLESDRVLCKKIGEFARATVVESFQWGTVLKDLKRLYNIEHHLPR
jgi:glycosyltransferase involved in cell wall biosynthesis